MPLSPESTAALQQGILASGYTITGLWVAAAGFGGPIRWADLADIASGDRPATPAEHNILAAALNDHFADLGHDHPVASWQELASFPA
ncbi:MAG: hypothetical protein JF603_05050 [Acidobacteria bacterium]|nr:hypothetical protein [Acidobacteriota bacterium]